MQLRSFLRLLAFAGPFFAPSSAKLTCKCLPGAACFPNASALKEFSANLSHPLISGQRPPASVCYTDSPNYDASACAVAEANEANVLYIASKINALQYANFQALINSTTIEDCPYDPQPGTTCFQGRVPPYAVNATTVSDIQVTIRFASKHNLRLVVRNTGHELMGRAFGVGALELFMHNFDTMQFSDSFTPAGAPKHTAGQYAVTMGAGVSWGEVFAAANQHNRSIAGGLAPDGTVGAAGGWGLGTGHSVLSPFYGLGVDNILQFSVVLPNLSFVIANKYQNADLFWALRGGGGPSFGVVVSTTARTHPNLPYTVAYYAATGNTASAYNQLLELWVQHHNAIGDAGWSGVWPFMNNTLYLTFFAQGVPPTSHTANATMEQFFAASKKIPGVDVSLAISHPYPTFQAWNEDNLIDSSKGLGFNFSALAPGVPRMAYSSWLMPRNLTTSTHAKQLADIFSNITVGLPFFVGGGAVAETDADDSAANPAWRGVISDMTILPIFAAPPDADVRVWQKIAYDQIQPLRDLAPPPYGGQYLNEPDIMETNWQQAYWGSHYPRLLAIKKTVDPLDLLIVRKGVNSESWDDEIICKTTN